MISPDLLNSPSGIPCSSTPPRERNLGSVLLQISDEQVTMFKKKASANRGVFDFLKGAVETFVGFLDVKRVVCAKRLTFLHVSILGYAIALPFNKYGLNIFGRMTKFTEIALFFMTFFGIYAIFRKQFSDDPK